MKQLLVVALVVVVVFTGIPVAMGMPMGDCPECGLGLLLGGVCFVAVLAAVAAVMAAHLHSSLLLARFAFVARLPADGLERPPRLG